MFVRYWGQRKPQSLPSFEDARILLGCHAPASSAALLSLTTSCATTCQSQPDSSRRRLALLEREGHGLPVKVEYVGTAGSSPLLLQYGWRPGSAQGKGLPLLGFLPPPFWSKRLKQKPFAADTTSLTQPLKAAPRP